MNGGDFMHNTTVLVLLFLTLGQILILTCGTFVLWLLGEFGDEPQQDARNDFCP